MLISTDFCNLKKFCISPWFDSKNKNYFLVLFLQNVAFLIKQDADEKKCIFIAYSRMHGMITSLKNVHNRFFQIWQRKNSAYFHCTSIFQHAGNQSNMVTAIVFKYCIIFILYIPKTCMFSHARQADVIDLAAPMKMT